MKQSDFDKFLCSSWKFNHQAGFLITVFVERNGLPRPKTFEEAYKILTDHGIERIPNKHYWFQGIGVWLANAYPQFLDAVMRSKDANKIVLAWLRYVEPKRMKTESAQRAANYAKKRYSAVRLADTIHIVQVRGDDMYGHRTKSPTGKRKI